MNKIKHALVIGGTGMLAGVCRYLAHAGYVVSIIGRTQSKFNQIQVECPSSSIYPIISDYNSDAIYNDVTEAIRERGSFDLIVSWTPNYATLERICEMNSGVDTFRLFQVKGSRRYFEDEPIRIPDNCNYRKVFLGFIKEGTGSRWLTHEEIANGVIQQIKTDNVEEVVGQIQPYEERPH